MRKSIAIFFTLMLSMQAFAVTIRSELTAEGELVKNLIFECNPTDRLCADLCQVQSGCVVAETMCESCATESSQMMKTIYTGLTTVFKTESKGIDQKTVAPFFKTNKFMTVSYDSFLNNSTPENKDEIKKQFESLCYIQDVRSALMLMTLNSDNHVTGLVAAICEDQNRNSVLLPMQFNPNFSNKTMTFWNDLNPSTVLP